MAVRCSKCGEELIGAVNRCWKCGQLFAQRPEIDGRPPVRAALPTAAEPLEAVVIGEELLADESATATRPITQPVPTSPAAAQVHRLARPATAEFIDSKRASLTAMGGTISSLVLGLFALMLALFRFEAALIALLGLLLGIWGLYSPKRGLALFAMLLCCLAIGLGSYTGAKQVYVYYKNRQPLVDEYDPAGP